MKQRFMSVMFVFLAASLFAQEIVTAERYLAMVSERYSGIHDYEARIAIRSGSTDLVGTVSHLEPSLLRIDFTRPANQVIVFNGQSLTIYLPEYRAVMTQDVSGGMSGASLASAQGLSKLRQNYVAAYVTGPGAQTLESGSSEQVVKLRLTRRSNSENFREIILNINPESRLIRRIEGRTSTDMLVRFDFTDIRINQGFSDQRFVYDAPATANMYNNFLFRDTD
ncbi:MAG: outer-membrane lipoprotein carrier protein LolA [Treponema sp.]|jgi:outer membrane lipoprotein-sorting protein|nr:outer-membrane lipoprotein carrier protein LolA [Treponema sp.]